MNVHLPNACQRVADAASGLGLDISIQIMAESTRTAEEAAQAVGTTAAQIVKSLIFKGKTSGDPILLLVSGANRVRENHVAKIIGEKILRPDAAFVREATGFAIGGIPPFGHAKPINTWLDEELLQFDTVFAAAGAPNAVFSVDPKELAGAVSARVFVTEEGKVLRG